MKGSGIAAGVALAAGYVHYALIAHFGGSPMPIVIWLGLFAAALVVLMKRALEQL